MQGYDIYEVLVSKMTVVNSAPPILRAYPSFITHMRVE